MKTEIQTRKIAMVVSLCAMLYCCGCASTKFYVMGIDIDKIVTEKDLVVVALGVIASVATHVVGHYVAAELVGANIDQQGVREIVTNHNELSNSDERWVARGGFVAQVLVSTVLTSFESTRNSKFMRGYALGTTLEIGFYPLRRRDDGDLEYLEENDGDGDLEWAVYTGLSLYNLERVINNEGR